MNINEQNLVHMLNVRLGISVHVYGMVNVTIVLVLLHKVKFSKKNTLD